MPLPQAGLRKHFAKIPRSPIAIEAPPQCRWVAKTLGDFDHEVIVANAEQVQLISANHSKNDSNDSAELQSSGKQNQAAKTLDI